MKLLNYMAAGKAIVASAGSAKGLVDGVTARVVPDGDAAAFADAIVGLLRDPAARARLGPAPRAPRSRAASAWDAGARPHRGHLSSASLRADVAGPCRAADGVSHHDDRPRVAITMGDAAGIGPEITVKSLADPRRQRVVHPARPRRRARARAGDGRDRRPRCRSGASAAPPRRPGRAGHDRGHRLRDIDMAAHRWGVIDPALRRRRRPLHEGGGTLCARRRRSTPWCRRRSTRRRCTRPGYRLRGADGDPRRADRAASRRW